ncbi:MFS transporter [Agaricicola taiwanensis]|uniref:MFS transporter n=1 Tax=Agaricicola taiwanensis TaxID=591372 RepID=A0A8J2YEM6_9RHOB|nr:MFS transporter [Agaricicola taiwanensis]GGE37708.1 MFS transporter [Agaricicola taiwanensis]
MTTFERVHHPVLILLALATGGFAIGTTEFAAMGLLPYFATDLGLDEPTAGNVISIYALGVCLGAPLIAVLGARMPRRTLLVWLMGFFAVANGFSALAPTYEWMLVFRFLSGLPHGAYFGVAMLLAASLVPSNRRAQAISRVILGLTVATIIGVPLASAIGQNFGWRWGFVIVAALATTTAVLVHVLAPIQAAPPGASRIKEISGLANRQVWLLLGIGAIGFGGLFCVYTYLASTILEVTRAAPIFVPLLLGVFGLGMTVGTIICAWAADRALMPTMAAILLVNAAALMIYPETVGNLWLMAPVVFVIGCGGGLSTVVQTRLMDVAGESQTLVAALNHSAFNVANALGPWLGGLAIAAGWGLHSTGWVGAGLALGGFAIWCVAMLDTRGRAARVTA